MQTVLTWAAAFLLTVLSPIATAHSGKTDSRGGHYDRKTGGYHYHGGGSTSYRQAWGGNSSRVNHGRREYKTEPRKSANEKAGYASRRARLTAREQKRKAYRAQMSPVDLRTISAKFKYTMREDSGSTGTRTFRIDLRHPIGKLRPKHGDLLELAQAVSAQDWTILKIFLERGHYSHSPWRTISRGPERMQLRFEDHQHDLDYEIYQYDQLGPLLKVKIVLYAIDDVRPTQDELSEIASSVTTTVPYVIRFYIAGMNLDNPEWAKLQGRSKSAATVSIYESRAPRSE